MVRIGVVLCTLQLLLMSGAFEATKRGIDGKDCSSIKLFGNSVSWHYHYGDTNPGCDLEWVPMLFSHGSIQDLNTVARNVKGAQHLLGYNEPNAKNKVSPQQAAEDWKAIQNLSPSSKGTPAPAGGSGIQWFKDFKKACADCHFDFVAIHQYSCHCNSASDCNADKLKKYIDDVYSIWQKPIWLTEFNCGDGSRQAPEQVHLWYMPKALAMLESNPKVARYSWMSLEGTPVPGAALVKDGELTKLGHLYKSYAAGSNLTLV